MRAAPWSTPPVVQRSGVQSRPPRTSSGTAAVTSMPSARANGMDWATACGSTAMPRRYHERGERRYAGWTQRRRRNASVVPGGGTCVRAGRPNSAARRRSSAEARSASAAIVSDGFTQSEVGTAARRRSRRFRDDRAARGGRRAPRWRGRRPCGTRRADGRSARWPSPSRGGGARGRPSRRPPSSPHPRRPSRAASPARCGTRIEEERMGVHQRSHSLPLQGHGLRTSAAVAGTEHLAADQGRRLEAIGRTIRAIAGAVLCHVAGTRRRAADDVCRLEVVDRTARTATRAVLRHVAVTGRSPADRRGRLEAVGRTARTAARAALRHVARTR